MSTVDDAMRLKDAAKTIKGRPHWATVLRWITHGVKIRTGERKGQWVRLEAEKVGGCWYVTPAQLKRFFRSTTPGAPAPKPVRKPRPAAPGVSPGHAGAMERLQATGVI